jgi:cephalosporin hydroxylase
MCQVRHTPVGYTGGVSESEKPRTALEIAMARLKQRDAESGTVEHLPTEEQKAAIAEARSLHASKVAELQILQRSKLAGTYDPAERSQLEDEYRDQLRRLGEECERKVEKIRRAGRD